MNTMPGGDEKLRVLQVHNQHAPGWGGEETVVELERRLLCEHGHLVERFQVSNARLKNAHPLRQMLAAPGFLWSCRSYGMLRRKIREFRPAVVHVHNTFPELSPSVFWAAQRSRVPVVETLHNFRHVCANALLLRDGARGEDCVGRAGGPALRHRCYEGSFTRTAVVVATNALHRVLGTYRSKVDAYVALNDFNREIFARGGLPADKLRIKPNFVPLSSLGDNGRKRQAVFVGAMTPSKGVRLLLRAWPGAGLTGFDLLLAGDGPERKSLEREFAHLDHIIWCGRLERSEILRLMAESRVLLFPSLAYENCPMVVLEALSVGTPVVGANHSGLAAIIQHEREGLLFPSGDEQALASALRRALLADDRTWNRWSHAARQTQSERFSDAVNYLELISIYRTAIRSSAAS